MIQQLEIREPEDLALDHASASFGDQPASIEAPADRHREEHPTGLSGDVPQQRVKSFPPNRIHVARRVRSLNTERVGALMEPIQLIGLRSPITVRIIPQVAGDGAADGGVEKCQHGQPYPVRLLKERYGLSSAYAAVVAAE